MEEFDGCRMGLKELSPFFPPRCVRVREMVLFVCSERPPFLPFDRRRQRAAVAALTIEWAQRSGGRNLHIQKKNPNEWSFPPSFIIHFKKGPAWPCYCCAKSESVNGDLCPCWFSPLAFLSHCGREWELLLELLQNKIVVCFLCLEKPLLTFA